MPTSTERPTSATPNGVVNLSASSNTSVSKASKVAPPNLTRALLMSDCTSDVRPSSPNVLRVAKPYEMVAVIIGINRSSGSSVLLRFMPSFACKPRSVSQTLNISLAMLPSSFEASTNALPAILSQTSINELEIAIVEANSSASSAIFNGAFDGYFFL